MRTPKELLGVKRYNRYRAYGLLPWAIDSSKYLDKDDLISDIRYYYAYKTAFRKSPLIAHNCNLIFNRIFEEKMALTMPEIENEIQHDLLTGRKELNTNAE